MSTGRKSVLHNVCLRTFKVCIPLWRLCAEDLRVCRAVPRVSNRVQLPPFAWKPNGSASPLYGASLCSKPLPIPRKPIPVPTHPSKPKSARKPTTAPSPITSPPAHEKPAKRPKHHLFTVSPDIDTEALLANASEDLLSISAIAADLADDVEGSRRSVALALSRMADGVQLLVERALDHHEESQLKVQAGV
ncbi:hypothetical protein PSHI_31800 [Pseudomonas sp. URMO17WK12:I11]|nr:hypothetical protein PSHI_31800 [Pseudomonas sp. URMO17WK12:I11]